MIKVALFSGYGENRWPKQVLDKAENMTAIEARIMLAKYIEENSIDAVGVPIKNEFVKSNPEKFICVRKDGDSSTYVEADKKGNIYTFTVRNVDESRKWKISEYDGAESVKYFEEPIIIEEKYNYCQF